MNDFTFRALELHSSRMWQQAQVEQALDFIEKNDMTALVFNQNDIIDAVVFPQAYFPDPLMWRRWPPRNTAVKNNRAYLNSIIRLAKSKGIEFYYEAKEIAFPQGLLEIRPELVNKDGSLCPFHPFWPEFLKTKLEELCRVTPDFAGIIFSIGTRESMLSVAANQCTCEQCRTRTEYDWYYTMFSTIFSVLDRHGKRLIIRDFSFTGSQQGVMIDAARKCSDKIIVSLKNTPRDYYPPYPTNPHIGTTGLTEWIEFDTWGQFYGLGIFPASVVEDMQRRLRECREKGAEGMLLRTDWECLNEGSAFSGMNLLNVYAGALLSRNLDCNLNDVYRVWAAHGCLSGMCAGSCLSAPSVPTAPDAWEYLRDFMKASWRVIEKTNYVRSLLFGESVLPPDTVEKAFDMMVHVHGRDDWQPGSSRMVEPTQENLAIIFAEKAAALQEVKALPSILRVRELGFSKTFVREMEECLVLYVWFVEMMCHCTKVCFLTRRAQKTKNKDDAGSCLAALAALKDFTKRLHGRLDGTCYHHHIYFMLDENRLRCLATDAKAQLDSIRP